MGRQHYSIDKGLTMLYPLCNSESKYSFSTQYVRIRKCLNSSCGHLFAESPSQTQGEMTYSESDMMEFSVFRQKNALWFDRNHKIVDYLVNNIAFSLGGKIIDLVSGTGNMAKSFIEKGFEAVCVEPSNEGRKILTKYELVNYSYMNDIPQGEKFDAIVLSEVIEHLSDPVQTLKEAKGRLSDRGIIFITTPRARGIKAILRLKNSAAYAEPTHIHFFTSKSLEKCFQLSSFSSYQRHHLDFMVPGRSLVLKTIDKILYPLDLNPHLIYLVFN